VSLVLRKDAYRTWFWKRVIRVECKCVCVCVHQVMRGCVCACVGACLWKCLHACITIVNPTLNLNNTERVIEASKQKFGAIYNISNSPTILI